MSDDAAWHRRDVLALAILVLGVSLFHLRGLRPGQTFLPVDLANNNLPWRSGPPQPLQNWLISDPLYEFYPFLVNAVNTVRHSGSWPLVTWFEATHRISTLSWLPGVLWAFELAVRRRSLRYTALAALMMALAALGGQFQFIVTFSLFLGLYAVGRTTESARRGDRAYAWPLVVLTVTVSLGALLSAIQTVPFAEFLNLSRRVLSRGLLDPLPSQQLITLIVPDFYGNPTSVGPYWGAFNFSEGTIYAGLPALPLACAAPLCARRFFVSYMSLVTIATLFFVLGGPGVQMLVHNGGNPSPVFRSPRIARSWPWATRMR